VFVNIVIFPRLPMRLVILRLLSIDDVKDICRRVMGKPLVVKEEMRLIRIQLSITRLTRESTEQEQESFSLRLTYTGGSKTQLDFGLLEIA